MTRDFKEALRHRRTYYHITDSSPISDEQIKEIIDFAVMNVPSAFNSQSTRIVLLLGKNHKKLWEITKETLKRLVSAEVFKGTEAKIDGSLAAGYGTILFFEDKAVVEQLQDSFPTYYDKFPVWAQQTSAMHQLAIWTMFYSKTSVRPTSVFQIPLQYSSINSAIGQRRKIRKDDRSRSKGLHTPDRK